MKTKQNFLYALLFVMVFQFFIPTQQTQAASLKDIPPEMKDEIEYLIQSNVIAGYPDGTFKPNKAITREEIATIIGKTLGLNGTKRQTKFPDVNPKSFGSGYIASAVDAGFIVGHKDGTFGPKENITRGHVAIMLQRAFQLKGQNVAVFKDVPQSDVHLYKAVDALVSNGILTPTSGSLYPNERINRAEFSLLIARTINEGFRQNMKTDEYIVNTATLNVRSGPGTNYSIVGKLARGAKVVATTSQGSWYYMKANNVSGFVHKDYLKKATSGNVNEADVPKRYIAIDAGHGGSDPGSSGHGLKEKEVTLAVAKKVEQALAKQNVKVFMTRTDDRYISLGDRVAMANRQKVDTLVSIHTNSFSTDSANGTETFYNLARVANTRVEDSKQLATFIQNRLYKDLETRNRGVKTANFAVIRTTFPSALVELAFISNKSDAQKLGSDYYQQVAADAIAAGILDYYQWKESK